MNQQTKYQKNTGPEAARRLKALFEEWALEEAGSDYEDEPSWEEIKKALNEGRPADGEQFQRVSDANA